MSLRNWRLSLARTGNEQTDEEHFAACACVTMRLKARGVPWPWIKVKIRAGELPASLT